MERGSYRGDRARGDGRGRGGGGRGYGGGGDRGRGDGAGGGRGYHGGGDRARGSERGGGNRGRGGGGRCYGGRGGRGYGGGGDRGRGDGAGGGRGYRGGGDRGRGSERGDGNRGFGFDVSAARCYRHTLKPTAQGLSLCLDYSVLLMEPKDHLDTESALCLKKLSLVSPKQRKENIDKLINSKDGPSGGDIIGNFGLKVEKEMTEMSGSEIMTSPQDASSSKKSQPINEGSEFVDRVDLLVNRLENPFEVSELDGEGRFGKGDTEEAILLLQALKLSEKEAHSSSQGDSVSKDETLKSAEKLPYVLSNKKESKTVLDFTAEEDFDNGGQGDLQAALRP